MSRNSSNYEGSTLLITGGTGSIGRELAGAVLLQDPKRIVLFSNDENGLFEAKVALGKDPRIEYRLGDVTDSRSVESAIRGCEGVFHAAALKHVDFCEQNPYAATHTNVVGTQNVIECAIRNECTYFVYVSTDKAVNPISTMGATKLLGEKLTLTTSKSTEKTVLSCVRFGNVLGSRGSVLLIFERQIRRGGPITVTNPEMTRFVMLPSEAAKLVLHSCERAKAGEIFVLKMPALKIGDLASSCRTFFGARRGNEKQIKISIIGSSPGEKLHEELMTISEISRAREHKEFYVIPPDAGERNPSVELSVKGLASNMVTLLSEAQITSLLTVLYERKDGYAHR